MMPSNSSFFKKGYPRPFLNLFSSFQTYIQFLQQIYVKKCNDHPVYGAGIRSHDLRKQESPPITTRPGLN